MYLPESSYFPHHFQTHELILAQILYVDFFISQKVVILPTVHVVVNTVPTVPLELTYRVIGGHVVNGFATKS